MTYQNNKETLISTYVGTNLRTYPTQSTSLLLFAIIGKSQND